MAKYTCRCGGTEYLIKPKGTQTGLYCKDCGRWIKWLGKAELQAMKKPEKRAYAEPERHVYGERRIRTDERAKIRFIIRQVFDGVEATSDDARRVKAELESRLVDAIELRTLEERKR